MFYQDNFKKSRRLERIIFGAAIIGIISMAGCSDSKSNYPGPNAPYPGEYRIQAQSPFEITPPGSSPQPEHGKASISGTLYSITISSTVPKTSFYLTKASGEGGRDLPPAFTGPELSRGDIAGTTNEKGQFAFNNIPPGNYFFVVSAPFSWSLAVTSNTDLSPLLIELKADQPQPLGIVYVSWP